MDIFSFDLVLNVDHCIIWSWTMPTMVTSVLEYLKIIPKCKKKKNDCCVFQKATLYYFSVLNLILRLILPRTWIYSSLDNKRIQHGALCTVSIEWENPEKFRFWKACRLSRVIFHSKTQSLGYNRQGRVINIIKNILLSLHWF